MPNPWDRGSARLFESLGFEALATTSSGFAATLGRLDGRSRATRRSPTPRASWTRSTCRCPPTSRTASPTIRPAWPRPCGWRSTPASRAARSRTTAGRESDTIYDAGPRRRARGGGRRGRARRAAQAGADGARREPRARPRRPATTRSRGSRASRRPAPTCSSRRACATWTTIRERDLLRRPARERARPARHAERERAGGGRRQPDLRRRRASPTRPTAPPSKQAASSWTQAPTATGRQRPTGAKAVRAAFKTLISSNPGHWGSGTRTPTTRSRVSRPADYTNPHRRRSSIGGGAEVHSRPSGRMRTYVRMQRGTAICGDAGLACP